MATMSYLSRSRTATAITNSFGILEIENIVVDEIPGTVIDLNLQINNLYYHAVSNFTVTACPTEIFTASPINSVFNCPELSNYSFSVHSNISSSTVGKRFSIDTVKGSTALENRVTAVVGVNNIAQFGNIQLDSYLDYDLVNMYIRDSENPIEDVLIGTFRIEECLVDNTLAQLYPPVNKRLLFRLNAQAPVASFAIANYLDISPYVSGVTWIGATPTNIVGYYIWRYTLTYTDTSFMTAEVDVIVQDTPLPVESLVLDLNAPLPNPSQAVINLASLYDVKSVTWKMAYATNVAGTFVWRAEIDYNFNRPGTAFNDYVDVSVKVGISERTSPTGINQLLTTGDPMPVITDCVNGYTFGTIEWMGNYNTTTAGNFLWDIKITYSDMSYDIVSIQALVRERDWISMDVDSYSVSLDNDNTFDFSVGKVPLQSSGYTNLANVKTAIELLINSHQILVSMNCKIYANPNTVGRVLELSKVQMFNNLIPLDAGATPSSMRVQGYYTESSHSFHTSGFPVTVGFNGMYNFEELSGPLDYYVIEIRFVTTAERLKSNAVADNGTLPTYQRFTINTAPFYYNTEQVQLKSFENFPYRFRLV